MTVRIIAGEFRGRRLLPPESDATRPITDRAKQSLFDVLTPLIDGAVVFDCFAGTGSMGLECLSRGAEKAVFFERDRSALTRLKQNIETLRVTDRSFIVAGDLFKAFGARGSSAAQAGRANIVFLDPPYRFLKEMPDQLSRLVEHLVADHVTPDATVVFRHDQADQLPLPVLTRYDQRNYGPMAIELLRPTVLQ